MSGRDLIQNFSWQGFRGESIESLKEKLPSLLDTVFAKLSSTVEVKKNLYRSVFRLPELDPNLGTLYLKRYRFPRLSDKLKYFFLPTRAEVEWEVARGLAAKGVNTLEALAYGEKKSGLFFQDAFFLSKEIPAARTLDRFLADLGGAERGQFFESLAKFLAELHNKEVHHRDLHQSNLLARDGSPVELFLLDLHTAKLGGALTVTERKMHLAQCLYSLRHFFSKEQSQRFLEQYRGFAQSQLHPRDLLWKDVERQLKAIEDKQARSRDKRCVVESSAFEVRKNISCGTYRRRDFPFEWIEKALVAHEKHPQTVLKEEGRSRVTQVKVEESGKSLCVKEIRSEGFLQSLTESFRGSRGKRAWKAAHALHRRGISIPVAYALQESLFLGLPQSSAVIMDYLEDCHPLLRFLENRYPTLSRIQKKQFLENFARFVASVHRAGIYHRDFQTRNVLVDYKTQNPNDAWKFFLIDLESVDMGAKLNLRRRLRNLMQLNDSPTTVSRTDRQRFLRSYQSALGIPVSKQEIREVSLATQARRDRAAQIKR